MLATDNQSKQKDVMAGVMTRFKALYPMLLKQRAKSSGAGQTQAFISASNKVSKETQANKLQASVPLMDKVKIMTVIAKSEVASLGEEEMKDEALINQLLSEIDQVCKTTDALEVIADDGLFLICLLIQIGKQTNMGDTLSMISKIMMIRAQNYITMRTKMEEKEDEVTTKEISLVNDE